MRPASSWTIHTIYGLALRQTEGFIEPLFVIEERYHRVRSPWGAEESKVMLRTTFEILPGVGPKTTEILNAAGIRHWQDALDIGVDQLPIGLAIKKTLIRDLPQLTERYKAGDTLFFDRLLKPKDAWRLFSSFPEKCVCFDIETTGLSPDFSEITVISTYRPASRDMRVFVLNENLDDFPASLADGDVLVGFNSRGFDTPFIKKRFHGLLPQLAQLDIRWVLHSIGVRGGLKDIERGHFAIDRPASLRAFDGFDAVSAWHRWVEQGDRNARDKLVRYCCADSFVLDYVVRQACRKMGCQRFTEHLPSASLFESEEPTAWLSALPDLAPPIELVAAPRVPLARAPASTKVCSAIQRR